MVNNYCVDGAQTQKKVDEKTEKTTREKGEEGNSGGGKHEPDDDEDDDDHLASDGSNRKLSWWRQADWYVRGQNGKYALAAVMGDVDEDFRPRGRDHHPECLPTSDFVNVVNYRFSGGICPQTRHTDDSKRRERRAIESALYERAAAYHAERAGRIQVAVDVRDALIASARR